MVSTSPPPADRATAPDISPWPHRLAWALASIVLSLIWVGSMVTTYRAGMSVEDWPTTYGHWFWPLQEWIRSHWDTFLEHGHRTLAQLVGVLGIATSVALWRADRRPAMRWLAAAIFAGVCLQGTLGGLRVIWVSTALAKIHGCTAPLYFACCAAAVTLTGRGWRQALTATTDGRGTWFRRLAIALCGLLYADIVLGVQLRHPVDGSAPVWFDVWLWLKLIVAGLVLATAAWLTVAARRQAALPRRLARRTALLLALLLVQLSLGAATWVTHYGWPQWFKDYLWAADYTIVAHGILQVQVTCAHVAIGALCLAVAVSVVLWSDRAERGPSP